MEQEDLFDKVGMLESTIEDLIEKYDELQTNIFKLEEKHQALKEFLVPLKYRKRFPKEGESEFFETKQNFKVDELSGDVSRLAPFNSPPKSEDLQSAKERMAAYAMEKDKIVEWYWNLYEQNWVKVKETLIQEEADKWETEGPQRYHLYSGPDLPSIEHTDSLKEAEKWVKKKEGNWFAKYPLNRSIKCSRRVLPKPTSSEASSTSSPAQD